MRAAVYCGTRNVYQDMIPSMKSLLIHSNVEKIYFLIEDDKFPYDLPPEVECINVSDQKWFPQDGPNFTNPWSYMILLRAAFSKIFPNLDRILSLDCDTIIRNNINELWELNLDNYYFAGVTEPKKLNENIKYFNGGVLLFNLKKIREDKKDEEYINDLNNCFRYYPEQECFSELSQGYILELSSEYNLNKYTSLNTNEKILHFAAQKNWQNLNIVKEYLLKPIERNKSQMIGLDIIIPTYKNIKNLKNTLTSITWDNKYPIHVTIVDDGSQMDYSSLKLQYPWVQWLQLKNNSGPGVARQYGTDNTFMPYITYLDSGDTFNANTINLIFKEIENNNTGYFYIWHFYDGDTKKQSHIEEEKPCGKVYKREFITRYNIQWPTGKASYACEDYGFVRTCHIILNYLYKRDGINRIYTFDDSIANLIPDINSLTHQNNFEFIYNNAIEGLILNNYHIIQQCKQNKIPMPYLIEELNYMIIKLYWFFLLTINNRAEFSEINWKRIKNFYDICYSKYELTASKTLIQPYHIYNTSLIIPAMKKWNMPIRINIYKFLKYLKEYTDMRRRYKF